MILEQKHSNFFSVSNVTSSLWQKQYPISKFKEYLVVNLASQPPKTEGYKGVGYREPICPNDDFIER